MLVENIAQWVWRAMGNTKSEILYTLVVFIGVLLVVRYVQWLRYVRTLPPGPWGIPIFGYLPFIKNDVHLRYSELAEKYGPLFSVQLGSKLVVVISDYRLIRDTFRREEFTGRPHTEFISILDGYGIINTQGALWKDQRKFLYDKLRNFGMTYTGMGKRLMESRIMREVNMFLRGLELRRGAPTNISSSLAMSISNVICSIIMGVRFQHGDTQFKRFMGLIEDGFKLFGSVAAVNYIPILRYLPWVRNVHQNISRNRDEMADFFQQTVNQHKETFNRNNIRDLIDTYLFEIQQAKETGREAMLFQGKDQDRQVQQILGDLFSAGMETVKTTMEWAMLMMLHHPEAAKAVQDELDAVVGRSRMPMLEDFAYLPITEATILEVLRRSNIVPLGTTHATTRDVTVNGYTIPSGASVVPLLYAVHMNPELWDEPEAFRPSRFLNDEGRVSKPEYFMPFGVGRRMCLGDTLARMELFMFFSSLMHSFNLKVPEGASLPSMRGNSGVTMSPDSFNICLLQRELNLTVDCNSNEVSSGPLRNVGSH